MTEHAPQKTILYGMGKVAKELGPAAWEARAKKVLEEKIIPNASPQWQARLEKHKDTIAKTTGWLVTGAEVGIVAGVTYGGVKLLKKKFGERRVSINTTQVRGESTPSAPTMIWPLERMVVKPVNLDSLAAQSAVSEPDLTWLKELSGEMPLPIAGLRVSPVTTVSLDEVPSDLAMLAQQRLEKRPKFTLRKTSRQKDRELTRQYDRIVLHERGKKARKAEAVEAVKKSISDKYAQELARMQKRKHDEMMWEYEERSRAQLAHGLELQQTRREQEMAASAHALVDNPGYHIRRIYEDAPLPLGEQKSRPWFENVLMNVFELKEQKKYAPVVEKLVAQIQQGDAKGQWRAAEQLLELGYTHLPKAAKLPFEQAGDRIPNFISKARFWLDKLHKAGLDQILLKK